jgi:hypothetical protein
MEGGDAALMAKGEASVSYCNTRKALEVYDLRIESEVPTSQLALKGR